MKCPPWQPEVSNRYWPDPPEHQENNIPQGIILSPTGVDINASFLNVAIVFARNCFQIVIFGTTIAQRHWYVYESVFLTGEMKPVLHFGIQFEFLGKSFFERGENGCRLPSRAGPGRPGLSGEHCGEQCISIERGFPVNGDPFHSPRPVTCFIPPGRNEFIFSETPTSECVWMERCRHGFRPRNGNCKALYNNPLWDLVIP